MKKKKKESVISDRKVLFSYEIVEKHTAGIVLRGSEIKSIRLGNANLQGAYCYFHNNELWLKGLHINPYAPAAHHNHEPMRTRKLLLQKRVLRKLQKQKKEQGYAIVVLRVFINEKSLAKVEIATAKGRKSFDKRAFIKERDIARKIRSEN